MTRKNPKRTAGIWLAWLVVPALASLPELADPGAASEAPAEADLLRPPRPVRAVGFRWENDAVGGTDENYSNGISLTYLHSGRGLLGGLWGWFGVEEGQFFSSYDVGHIIYTPMDTDRPIPDPEDRPYAGILYASVSTQLLRGRVLHDLKLVTGVVGPASQAELLQTSFHELIGDDKPQGWAFQLHNEPIFNLVYEQRRKYPLLADTSAWSAEIIPVGNVMLGNLLIQAQAGAQVRFGYQVPDNFGTTLIRSFGALPYARPRRNGDSEPRWGAYVFAGGSGVAVARNLSLDGNTFEDSPSVEKNPFFLTGEFGLSLWTRWGEVTASFVWSGEEFKNQARPSRFGALAITVPF